MSNFFKNKSRLNDFITFVLVFFFITQPVFAARSSTYGSVQKSIDIMQSGSNTTGSSPIKSLNGDKDVNLSTQQSINQNNLMLSQPSMPSQVIQVHIVGDVNVPGVFKAVLSTRAAEVIQKAIPNRPSVRLYTIENDMTGKRATYDLYSYYFYGSLKDNPYLRDGDVIRIPQRKKTIRIEGPVARAGEFELSYEKSLRQVVKLAGGFTSSNARHHPVKVIRFDDNGNKRIIPVEQTKSAFKKFRIKTGDVVIVPDVINAHNKFDYSLESIPGENHVYPTSVAEVFVIGAVLNPGPYPYKSHLTVKDYVGFSGAMADANVRRVKIVRNDKKKSFSMYDQVQAGDVIIVREKGIDVFMKYVSIFSTLIGLTTSAIVLKTYIDRQ